jgi:hypothetical protein
MSQSKNESRTQGIHDPTKQRVEYTRSKGVMELIIPCVNESMSQEGKMHITEGVREANLQGVKSSS